ncbi:MAG: amino-acid N-acetyltransferase [Pseudomonadales bacterium]|nr:amino-acid N-acetyltransferase [Pseudomonadales bacterium]
MNNNTKSYVEWFRNSAPYINANRNKTVVLMMSGEAAAHAQFKTIIHDIALLNSLGVKLVIVHGARSQIDQRLQERGVVSQFHQGLRVTDEQTLVCVKEAVGALRSEIEALLSMGLANSPMHGARLRVCSGNFVIAKPVGIRDGVNFGHTGEVRRVDCMAIKQQLDQGAIVLLPPIGFSPTGEVFDLSAEDLATETAIALGADKLILMCADKGASTDGSLIRELNTQEAEQLLVEATQTDEINRYLTAACHACHAGISRVHLVSYQEDGALITELYTRDGAGTLVAVKSYEQLRQANINDVGGIIELIRPLEKQGVLVRRSRELLEKEIDRFCVIERDGAVIACAALYPFDHDKTGELACFVVHPDYRNKSRGDQLLAHVSKQAKTQKLNRLVVLTTQAAHWFLERGFEQSEVASLPKGKQMLYNWQRNSSVFELCL